MAAYVGHLILVHMIARTVDYPPSDRVDSSYRIVFALYIFWMIPLMSILGGGGFSKPVIFIYIFFSWAPFKVNGDLRKNNIELACRYPNAAAFLAYY